MEPMKPLPGMKPMEPMRPMKPMEPLTPLPFVNPGIAGERPWWPAKLGTPEAAGGQNDVRYAYFADERRLAIERGDDVIVYDTADHRIHGVAQAQSGSGPSSLVFTSQHGTVPLDALKIVDVLRSDD
jgi:hypothetical protein